MKKVFQLFHPSSPEYVITHAAYRRSRGKKPTVGFMGTNNPRAALAAAEKTFRSATLHVFTTKAPITPRDKKAVYRSLGLQFK